MILAALLAWPRPAIAQVVCADRRQVTEHLTRNFGELQAGTGLTFAGRAIELFVAPTGTWTIVVTRPDGMACIISHGEAWQAKGVRPHKTGMPI